MYSENTIDHTVNIFNFYDENLQFTVKLPQNNSISFLDVKIIVNEQQRIITDWYQKQTFDLWKISELTTPSM